MDSARSLDLEGRALVKPKKLPWWQWLLIALSLAIVLAGIITGIVVGVKKTQAPPPMAAYTVYLSPNDLPPGTPSAVYQYAVNQVPALLAQVKAALPADAAVSVITDADLMWQILSDHKPCLAAWTDITHCNAADLPIGEGTARPAAGSTVSVYASSQGTSAGCGDGRYGLVGWEVNDKSALGVIVRARMTMPELQAALQKQFHVVSITPAAATEALAVAACPGGPQTS